MFDYQSVGIQTDAVSLFSQADVKLLVATVLLVLVHINFALPFANFSNFTYTCCWLCIWYH